jgi:hypothetical protein
MLSFSFFYLFVFPFARLRRSAEINAPRGGYQLRDFIKSPGRERRRERQ